MNKNVEWCILDAFGFLKWCYDNSSIIVTSGPHHCNKKSTLPSLSQTRSHLRKWKGETVTFTNSKQHSTVIGQNIIKIAACEIQDYFLKANV